MRRRRGVIFIMALAIIVVLTGLALVFAQSMRTEATASANRRSQAEADSIELGAEQWTMAQVDAYSPDAMTVTQVPAEAIQVGTGYFWIMQFNPDNDTEQGRLYGITDECSKLNINVISSTAIENLPTNIQQNVADAIIDWRSPAGSASSDGAESDYYQSLNEPYECKNAPYETLEEMLLVSQVNPQLLWGNGTNVIDLNRNGIIEDSEQQLAGINGGSFTGGGSGVDGRGIFNYLTCFTKPTTNGGANANKLLNINTASDVALMALGMAQNNAQEIISERVGQDYTDATWANSIIAQTPGLNNFITGQSKQYSADIVAVSGDGRAFTRVRIVVDATNLPSRIIYRKDLSSYGWPLPAYIREQLKAGQTILPGQGQSLTTTAH